MIMPPCRLVLFDCTDNALLLVEITGGHVLSRHPLPWAYRPLALLAAEKEGAFLFANSPTDGALFLLGKGSELLRIPIVLPTIAAACASPSGQSLYLASTRHTLYRIDLSSNKITSLGSAPHSCSALAANGDRLYSVWETDDGSICAIHDTNGSLLAEHRLCGTIPSAKLDKETLYLPFVGDEKCGEGLHLLSAENSSSSAATIPLRPPSMRGLSAYPYSVLVQDDVIHLVSEASGTITKIDRQTNNILGSYALGRSISHLYLLPDSRFAIATSNMFADLTLLDLVNEKLLSISICPHELFHQLAIFPPA